MSAASNELIVWTDGQRLELVQRLLDVMGGSVRPLGVGGPRTAPVGQLAQSLGCRAEDDLRKLIVENPAAFLLLASPNLAGLEDLKTAAAQGATILTLEPIAGDFDTLEQLEPFAANIHLAPVFSQSPGALMAADPTLALGDGRMIGFHSSGRNASLYTRLWDAWQTTLQYSECPQLIDAALISPGDEAPEHLPQLAGRLTAHGRMAEGGSVVLELAADVGIDQRTLHVVADHAELHMSDGSYQLHQIDGKLLDEGQSTEPIGWVDLIAQQWQRLLDRPAMAAGEDFHQRRRHILSCCLATLLSTRTGEPESPADLLRMGV
ncbi:MAG: hypothetical protein IT445_01510 [Phycisphaeraceae bacterium]|nr:hypothetical protein [Phycisphaeraceae bacterium]